MERLSELLSAIRPFVLGWISAAGGGSGPFAPSPHDLNSAHHTGSIADSQAPQFLLSNGGRTLTGNLPVSAGITIDGVDISVLAAEAFVTIGNTSGLPNERALTAGSGLTLTDGGANGTVTIALNTPGSLSATSTNSAAGNHTHAIDSTIARTADVVKGDGIIGRVAEWVTDTKTLQASRLAKTGSGVLTLAADANYTLTIPATGTAALMDYANIGAFTAQSLNINTDTGQQIYGNVTAAVIVSQTSGGTDETFDQTYEAVKFNSGSNTAMGSVVARLKRDAGVSATSFVQARLYTDNSGVPGSQVTSVQTLVFGGSINTSYSNHEWYLPATLTASTNYWIVFSKSVSGGNIYFDSRAGTNTHAYSSDLSSWTLENKELYYQVKGKTYPGVYGVSTNSYGVYGFSTNSYGVYGSSTNSLGVYGSSANSLGVYGSSTNLYGVYGFSTNSYGVYGFSTNSYGVYGSSTNSYAGVFNQTGSLTQNNTGNVVRVLRSLTLGAYTATGAVLRVESSVADTGNLVHVVKQSSDLFSIKSTGLVGIGTNSPATLVHGVLSNATISAVDNLLTLTHNSTGTPSAGFGSALALNLKTSTTTDVSAGLIEWLWNDPAHVSRKADLVFSAYDTVKREGMRIRGTGSAAAIGFLGAAPIARYSATGDLRQALIDFGLYTSGGATPLNLNGGALQAGSAAITGTTTARNIIPELTDTYDIGSSTRLWRKGWLSELDAVTFAENTVSVVGGWLMIPKRSGVLPADVAAAATQVNFGQAMTSGEFVLFRVAGQVEYMSIGSLVSGTTYNVTRNLDGTGANDWPAGATFVVLGVSGDGRIELNAYDTPRISLIRQGAMYNAQTEIVRIGDLNGMPGVSSETWGMFIGDASQYLKYANGTLTIAGNGSGLTQIDGGNIQTGTVTAAQINVSTLSALTANMGSLTSGSIVIGTTNKLWLNDAADGALNIGGSTKASAPFRVTATGALTATNATITGAITATSGDLGALSISGKLTMSGAGSAIAIGTTPPTSATSGTGIWIDRTGYYGLNAGTYQVKIDATDGKLYAGGGKIALASNGITMFAQTAYDRASALTFYDPVTSRDHCQIYTTKTSPLDAAFVQVSSPAYSGSGCTLLVSTQGGGTETGYSKIELFTSYSGTPTKGIRISDRVEESNSNVWVKINADVCVIDNGLNVGTATGAAAGQIKASGDVLALDRGKGLQAQLDDVSVISASGNVNLTSTYQDMTGLTTGSFTPAVNEYALVVLQMRFSLSAGSAACNANDVLAGVLDVYYSGTDHLESSRAGVTADGGVGSMTAVVFYKVALTAGTTYTLKVKVRNDSGSRGQAFSNSQMTVWRIAR